MPADATASGSSHISIPRFRSAARQLRRALAELPVIGPALRRVKRAIPKSEDVRAVVKRLRWRRPSESEQILELRRQVDDLRAKLRTHQPLIADYRGLCQRVVELEDQLLRSGDGGS